MISRGGVSRAIMVAISTVLAAFTVAACNGVPNTATHSGLPFYRSKELTPEWVSAQAAAGATMHRVPVFAFTNHRGERVTNRSLSGRVTLVHFFYASCGRVCPRAVSSIQRLLQSMPMDTAFQVLSYTVQPERDSVAALGMYARHHEITDARWQLLTGAWSDIEALATRGYFVNLRDGASYGTDDLAHTETLVLVDQDARIRGVYNATLALDMEQIGRDVKLLEHERTAASATLRTPCTPEPAVRCVPESRAVTRSGS